jgi:spore germination cell wall hydrolase CwlJ-like protein
MKYRIWGRIAVIATILMCSPIQTQTQDVAEEQELSATIEQNEIEEVCESRPIELIIIGEDETVIQEEEITEEKTINEEDLRYLSAIIYAEAGNQCEAGQQAVGIIIMNRVRSEYFKDTVYDVIYSPGQFTPTINGSFVKALHLYDTGEIFDSCVEAAKYALLGNTTVNYFGQTYEMNDYLFFSRYVSNCRLIIEDHQFK